MRDILFAASVLFLALGLLMVCFVAFTFYDEWRWGRRAGRRY